MAKDVRDRRRVTRAKQTTQQWRDRVDLIPEDVTIRQAPDADYRYLGIDTTDLDVAEVGEVSDRAGRLGETLLQCGDLVLEAGDLSVAWIRLVTGSPERFKASFELGAEVRVGAVAP